MSQQSVAGSFIVLAMKTSIKLAIAFFAGILLASNMQASNGASETYDAVKLAEYSACLAKYSNNNSRGFSSAMASCEIYKPK